MNPGQSHRISVTLAVLIAIPVAVAAYKIIVLGYSIADILPRKSYSVTYAMQLDGHRAEVNVRTFLPTSDDHQIVSDELNNSPILHFQSATEGLNRIGVWTGTAVPDGATLRYSLTVVPTTVRYDLDPALSVPESYPASIASYLRPEKEIQVDDPAVAATLKKISADHGTLPERLRAIYDYTSAMPQRPFKGTTDALTALRLGEASCNGKSRLFVALARASGIPARVVGGLILNPGRKRTSHQWVEAYVAGHWVTFCPTNHYFAKLPARYLTLYRGDEVLFRHTADINFDYAFETTSALIPSAKALASFRHFNVWATFQRLHLPFSLLRTVLMLPVGALVVVLFRNVIGMPTFGTFLPALIAAAAGETGALWGLAGVLIVVLLVGAARWMMQILRLLHSPTLAILLACVTTTMLTTTVLAEHANLTHLARISMFPIAVLAITAERFYLSLAEHGAKVACKELGGTFLVILCCYVVMNSLALQVLIIGFPEVMLFVLAANVYLGRWVGVRLFEYVRFRHLLRTEGQA